MTVAPIVVAIDGPAGAGKTTIAQALARRLGVPHVDTGAYYRAATLAVLRAGGDMAAEDAVLGVVTSSQIERVAGRTYLDGEDVEAEIRGPAVTAAVSAVSAHLAVRAALIELQRREVGVSGGVVEGRDAGTAVVPHAGLKVWLTAPVEVRAHRRALQLGEAGNEAIDRHAVAIAQRDAADAEQMARAADVVEVDTGGLGVDDIVERIVDLLPGPATMRTRGER